MADLTKQQCNCGAEERRKRGYNAHCYSFCASKAPQQKYTPVSEEESNQRLAAAMGVKVDHQASNLMSQTDLEAIKKRAHSVWVRSQVCNPGLTQEEADIANLLRHIDALMELPPSLRDPIKVMERGRELLKEWESSGDSPSDQKRHQCHCTEPCGPNGQCAYETKARQLNATERLHNICNALSEQADESPFTREEWEAVDRQTARLNSALKNLIDAVRNVEIEKRPWDLFMALPLQNAYRALKHQDALTEIVGPDGSPVETSVPLTPAEMSTVARMAAVSAQVQQPEKASDQRKLCSARHNDPNCPICYPEGPPSNGKAEHAKK